MAGLQAGLESTRIQRSRSSLCTRRENLAPRHRPLQQVGHTTAVSGRGKNDRRKYLEIESIDSGVRELRVPEIRVSR